MWRSICCVLVLLQKNEVHIIDLKGRKDLVFHLDVRESGLSLWRKTIWVARRMAEHLPAIQRHQRVWCYFLPEHVSLDNFEHLLQMTYISKRWFLV